MALLLTLPMNWCKSAQGSWLLALTLRHYFNTIDKIYLKCRKIVGNILGIGRLGNQLISHCTNIF